MLTHFQQRLTCRRRLLCQFWSHDLATTALHRTTSQRMRDSEAKRFGETEADFDCSSDQVQR